MQVRGPNSRNWIDDLIDRPLEQLDPVELSALLLIGVTNSSHRIDMPYRVVINEGVNLAKRFGALDGHKYINACLDVAAQSAARNRGAGVPNRTEPWWMSSI